MVSQPTSVYSTRIKLAVDEVMYVLSLSLPANGVFSLRITADPETAG